MKLSSWFAGCYLIATLGGRGSISQAQSGIPILTYHRFDPTTTVTTATFLSQLDTLTEQGYSVVPLGVLTDILLGKTESGGWPMAASEAREIFTKIGILPRDGRETWRIDDRRIFAAFGRRVWNGLHRAVFHRREIQHPFFAGRRLLGRLKADFVLVNAR